MGFGRPLVGYFLSGFGIRRLSGKTSIRLILMKRRILIVNAVLAAAGLALLAKSALLQLTPQTRLAQLKERLFETTVKVTPRRGNIYDRSGRELAISIPSPSLFADPQKLSEPYFAAKKLSKMLQIPKKPLLKRLLNKKKRFVWVKRHLSGREESAVRLLKLEGLYFLKESKRFYTQGESLSQTLGFTDIDGRGLEGIEKQYDKALRGRQQRFLLKRDARGRPLFVDFAPFIGKGGGSDIYLTIDSDLQFYFEAELTRMMKKSKAESALGLILDPNSSEILALVNLPNYNPNYPLKAKDPHHRRNRAVTDIFEPGSSLKTFTVIAALKGGMTPGKTYPTLGGELKVGKKIITEANAKKQLAPFLDLSGILSFSSNVGAASLALDLGAGRLRKTLGDFGFGRKTGIDFPGEVEGLLRDLPWKPVETATISFGHGVAATALQVAAAYAAVAGKGLLKRPLLARQIKNPYTGQEAFLKTETVRRVLSSKEAEAVTLMLTAVTEEGGTGFQAAVPGHLSAGKTGTAQKVDIEKGGYRKGEYISSFAGFIPAHSPEFVIYVVIDGAKGDFYASSVAAPVFARAASYAVRRAGLSPVLISSVLRRGEPASPLGKSGKRPGKRAPAALSQVPDFKGMSLREALRQVQGTGARLKIHGARRVVGSSPAAGQPLPSGGEISVFLN